MRGEAQVFETVRIASTLAMLEESADYVPPPPVLDKHVKDMAEDLRGGECDPRPQTTTKDRDECLETGVYGTLFSGNTAWRTRFRSV